MEDPIDHYIAARQTFAAVEAPIRRAALRVRLRPVLATVLVLLARNGPQPLSQMARSLAIAPQTLTEDADHLERDGLVCRQPHPTDRRIVLLALTEKGEETAAAFLAALDAAQDWKGEMLDDT